MIEVEVKAKADENIKDKLKSIGANKIRREHQKDLYFNAPHRDFKVTDEALRIRKTAEKIFITYKGPKIDKKSKTRQEIETEVSDFENLTRILEHLGFRKVREVIKEREVYKIDDFTVAVDKVKDLGTYLEIEKDINEDKDYDDTLKAIFKIYNQLGIEEGFERKSYLELLLESENGKR